MQGGSTITQQFVKNALRAQNKRTVFQKLREAALAYHLTRKWSKQQDPHRVPELDLLRQRRLRDRVGGADVLRQGPPGLRHAARRRASSVLRPEEAALLAGVVANPSGYDPIAHPQAAERRRNLVLQQMLEQGRLSRAAVLQRAPGGAARPTPEPPTVRTTAPYFTTWVRQQLVDRFGARRAFEGGLKITTTLDLDLQQAAENAVAALLLERRRPDRRARRHRQRDRRGPRDGRRARLQHAPVQPRHPGPAPAGLGDQAVRPRRGAAARHQPGSVWPSRKRVFNVPRRQRQVRRQQLRGQLLGHRTRSRAR